MTCLRILITRDRPATWPSPGPWVLQIRRCGFALGESLSLCLFASRPEFAVLHLRLVRMYCTPIANSSPLPHIMRGGGGRGDERSPFFLPSLPVHGGAQCRRLLQMSLMRGAHHRNSEALIEQPPLRGSSPGCKSQRVSRAQGSAALPFFRGVRPPPCAGLVSCRYRLAQIDLIDKKGSPRLGRHPLER